MPDVVKSGALSRIERDGIEDFCRQQCQVAPIDEKTALCRVLGKYLMYVPLDDDSMSPHLMLNGYWETWLTQAVARYVKPGMACVDVGAALGYYTLLLADLVGEKGRVEAWEPNELAMRLLRRSVRLNGYGDRVALVEKVCSRTESNDFEQKQPSRDWASTRFVRGVGRYEACSIDTAWPTGSVGFMKIDVEGHELAVWDGMLALFTRSPELAVLMETHAAGWGSFSQVKARLGPARVRAVDFEGKLAPEPPAGSDPWMLWITRV
jgi:FkbM family methyltransferase